MAAIPPAEPWPHPACADEEALLRVCTFEADRTSGPGGQHRNKVETGVVVTHTPTGLRAQATERRSQIENRRVALRRLRLVLATQHRTGVPSGEIGSVLWKSRIKKSRIVCSTSHHDFPAMLAEALDVIAATAWEPRKAAVRLGTTSSQIVRFLKEHPPALVELNSQRAERGLHAFK